MIVVVASFKGSMSKTTTCLNVARGIELLGVDALCVDLDREQHDLSDLCESAGIPCIAPQLSELNRYLDRPQPGTPIPCQIRLVETPPREDRAVAMALRVADYVIVPVACEWLALRGLSRILASIESVKADNPILQTRVLITMYSPPFLSIKRELLSFAGIQTCQTVIPRSSQIAQSTAYGQSVLQHAPKSRGAAAYRALAKEVLSWRFPAEKQIKSPL